MLQAQHAGRRGYSRMGGRLLSAVYNATNVEAQLKERLRRLDQETEQLRTLFAGLRARAETSVLTPDIDALLPRAPMKFAYQAFCDGGEAILQLEA